MRNGAVVDLDRGLVVFGDEYRGVITHGFTDPDVVVIVGVFDCLNCHPFLFSRIPFLLRDGGQTVAVVPRVQFAVRGIGFADTVALCVVRVGPGSVAGQFVIIAGRVSVAVGRDTVAVFVVGVSLIGNRTVGLVRSDELAEEVVIVGRLAVDGVQVLDNIVGIIVGVGVLDDLRSVRVFMRDRRDGVVRVVRQKRAGDFCVIFPPRCPSHSGETGFGDRWWKRAHTPSPPPSG